MGNLLRITFAAFGMGGILYVFLLGAGESPQATADRSAGISKPYQGEAPLQLQVILTREYLDGESSEETLSETVWAMEDFWAKYDNWELVDMWEGHVSFRKKIDDISPLLKANGYFGITGDGTLSIFNGKPSGLDIIQSFFQIDIKRLESTKQHQLLNGIPVKTKQDYEEVLNTFQPYSLEMNKKEKLRP